MASQPLRRSMCASPEVRLLVMFGKPPLDPARRHVAAAPALPTPTRAFPEAHLIPLPGTDPEDVVVGTDGMLYCGLAGGAIVRVHPDTHRSAIVATTGGRPLGLEPHGDGLLVCDAHRGLLRVDPATGHVATLVAHVDGSPLRFCSNAAVAPDDSIWFTESSTRFGFAHFMGAFMEHRPSGRLLRRDADGTVAVVLENLDFPNGLTLTPAGDALILVETAGYRISRIDLAAPQNPPHVLADNLPGFPTTCPSSVTAAHGSPSPIRAAATWTAPGNCLLWPANSSGSSLSAGSRLPTTSCGCAPSTPTVASSRTCTRCAPTTRWRPASSNMVDVSMQPVCDGRRCCAWTCATPQPEPGPAIIGHNVRFAAHWADGTKRCGRDRAGRWTGFADGGAHRTPGETGSAVRWELPAHRLLTVQPAPQWHRRRVAVRAVPG
ncbi:hypothetical protein FOB84_10290 [Gordonia bronchialis]|nr:hypothetical protein FOB84_10290 [Gordonia bronchialis]